MHQSHFLKDTKAQIYSVTRYGDYILHRVRGENLEFIEGQEVLITIDRKRFFFISFYLTTKI